MTIANGELDTTYPAVLAATDA
ncbi:MAG: hypothetical protein JWR53_329, partial [Glaciihabitans sp.]|nr:hypothetical protein [Glaciihabitans sp.]